MDTTPDNARDLAFEESLKIRETPTYRAIAELMRQDESAAMESLSHYIAATHSPDQPPERLEVAEQIAVHLDLPEWTLDPRPAWDWNSVDGGRECALSPGLVYRYTPSAGRDDDWYVEAFANGESLGRHGSIATAMCACYADFDRRIGWHGDTGCF